MRFYTDWPWWADLLVITGMLGLGAGWLYIRWVEAKLKREEYGRRGWRLKDPPT